MKNAKNHGVSFIEILIAVVIFTICIIPITNQLMSGIRIGQKADNQQAATDYATSVAETMKQLELRNTYEHIGNTKTDAETDKILAGLSSELNLTSLTPTHKFYSIRPDGTDGTQIPAQTTGGSDITAMYQSLNQYNNSSTTTPEMREALVREYSFLGKAEDVDYRDYIVSVNLSTKNYALEELAKGDADVYQDPNAVNIGNLSSLDSDNTVLLTELSNMDQEAYKTYFDRIVAELQKEGTFDTYIVNLNTGSKLPGTVTKKINIDVTDPTSGSSNYCRVVCTVTYEITLDSSTVPGNASEKAELLKAFADMDKKIIRTVKSQEYEQLPDIYLLYNQFLYDGQYGNDVIQVNNKLTEKKTVNVFVVRTAETDANIQNISPSSTDDSEPEATPAKSLLPNNKRDELQGGKYRYTISMLVNGDGVQTYTSVKDHPVHIYTNILTYIDGGTVKDLSEGQSIPYQRGVVKGNGTYKLSVNINASDDEVNKLGGIILPLAENDRYSETGRLYDITVTLYDPDTYDMSKIPEENASSKILEIDTSKGDY